MLHHGNLAWLRRCGGDSLHHFDPPHYLPHLLLQRVNLLLLDGKLFVGTDDFRIFLLQLGFQFLVQTLDGGQGDALGIGCANGLVVIAKVKSRVEILGHGAEVLAAAGIRAEAPGTDGQLCNTLQDAQTIYRMKSALESAVAGATPASGRAGERANLRATAEGDACVREHLNAALSDHDKLLDGRILTRRRFVVTPHERVKLRSLSIPAGRKAVNCAGDVALPSGNRGADIGGLVPLASAHGRVKTAGRVSQTSGDCREAAAGVIVLAAAYGGMISRDSACMVVLAAADRGIIGAGIVAI